MTNGMHVVNAIGNITNEKLNNSSVVQWWNVQWKPILAEFVSTFLLIFLGCMSCIPLDGLASQPPLYVSLGFGLIVLFNISAFGHISGAHMNPSVTLTAMIWGKTSIGLGIGYVIAQCLGSIVGYGLLVVVSPFDLIPGAICATQPRVDMQPYQALIVEIILSSALGFINCAVWDPVNVDKDEANSLKFGLTIAAFSIAGGPLTGASMNPARTLGPSLWTNNWNAHWVYWVGPLIGGAFAGVFYKLIWFKREKDIL
ncbi:aquaporin AQPAe.a-like [Pieris rapae]|uniref:aquaporin AQPAe.a-like n=1 Tax=Pieris rapae TaxID=64459 RepID=UPI001E27DA9C|nr:aquaporin AQPAe.a-like [Pieris rapae]